MCFYQGIDLARLEHENRFKFVDGLTHLLTFAASTGPSVPGRPASFLPLRSAGVASTSLKAPAPAILSRSSSLPTAIDIRTEDDDDKITLTSPALEHALTAIMTAIKNLRARNPERRVQVIFDSPSILLHTTSPVITTIELVSFILTLRRLVSTCVVALPADMPFLNAATQQGSVSEHYSPLEVDTAALAVCLAHQAAVVLGCRLLDTGWAKDVSGVIRATRGGAAHDWDVGGQAVGEDEWLYHIAGDGAVSVWDRGAINA